jgi:hypothetical protein
MAQLIVDLRTDFTRRAFGFVEIHLTKRDRRRRMGPTYFDILSTPAGDLVRGVRLAEIQDLDDGLHFLVVRLLNATGAPIAMRRILVTVRGNTMVLAVLAR